MEDIANAVNALNTGDLVQAESICQRIIEKCPQHVQALHILGIIFNAKGNHENACEYLKRARKLQPDNYIILLNLGYMQMQLGRLEDAEASFRTVVRIKPDETSAYISLGNVLKRLGKYEESIACHEHAVLLNPLSAEERSNLASAYLSWNKREAAIAEYLKAVAMQPDSAELHFNLGTAFQKAERYEDACVSFRLALKLNPDHVRAIMNMGTSLRSLGALDEAIDCLRRATEIAPDYADAQWNLALTLLMAGDYTSGWKAYEWRLKIPDIPIRKLPHEYWDGSVRPGKTLLLYTEQGIGDAIQFIRYAGMARARVGRIILQCHTSLVRLLSDVDGVDQVLSDGEPVLKCDLCLPLLSLPRVLGATLEDIPNKIPYLKADDRLTEQWRSKMDPLRYKIGVAWAGNPKHLDDHNRSCNLTAFAHLMKLPGVIFYSLQKENPDMRSMNVPEGISLIDKTNELTDFADTAALIVNLDLIITVDTSVAHLAGALGRPVWTLLPFAPDWRWMLNRNNTPWYPTMRLFRQKNFGDWDSVFVNVEKALRKTLESL
jgi:tetratricopeptide (TPR) repeat protein